MGLVRVCAAAAALLYKENYTQLPQANHTAVYIICVHVLLITKSPILKIDVIYSHFDFRYALGLAVL